MNKYFTKTLSLALALVSLVGQAKADKGMWLLNELSKENIAQMKALGFELTPEQLYSLDKPSVASSVIIFGAGCTGVTVSASGLVMTNHHCGYDAIQKVSSVKHDYLRDGFVSQSNAEELPIEGLEVRYLVSMKDVTSQLLAKVKGIRDEATRIKTLQEEISLLRLEEQKKAGKNQEVIIRPYYAGNKYYQITYDVFKDIRMVFAPPSSIGKFGGDTDNWMWPRHTGDFAVFRVYADKDNKPSIYSKDNKPFNPKYFAEVSTKGVRSGDYAMTIGFPGRTSRYIPSWGIESRIENENNPRIEVRGIKQGVWRKHMDADQATRIKYASKYARSSNYWKNSIGMNQALARLDVVGRKRQEEANFAEWVKNSKNKDYQNILADLKKAYQGAGELTRRLLYVSEALSGSEVLMTAASLMAVQKDVNAPKDFIPQMRESFYKNYTPEVDKETIPLLLNVLRKNIKKDEADSIFLDIDRQFGGDTEAFVRDLFQKSFVPYESKFAESYAADNFKERLAKDPAYILGSKIQKLLEKLRQDLTKYANEINRGNRIYFAGRQEQDPSRPMPSDANSTMRLSYGSVKGYNPKDAVSYDYYTTSAGILEKFKPRDVEFDLKDDFVDLLKKRNWGRWEDRNTRKLHIAFLSTNDITGGNSGSPVFDKNGRVIGLAFDGNWEAMSGDIEFEPELQRTISVDIRYVLYVIEQWGKCPRLISELKLI